MIRQYFRTSRRWPPAEQQNQAGFGSDRRSVPELKRRSVTLQRLFRQPKVMYPLVEAGNGHIRFFAERIVTPERLRQANGLLAVVIIEAGRIEAGIGKAIIHGAMPVVPG